MRVLVIAMALVLSGSASASSSLSLDELFGLLRDGLRDSERMVECDDEGAPIGPTPSLKPLIGSTARRIENELGLPLICRYREQGLETCLTWGELRYQLDPRCEGWYG